jgi:hypothetical protein
LDDVGTSGGMDIVETASDAEEANGLLYEEIPESGNARTVSLQIPQKLQIVIDPFEMDGKGQIYSEQYMVRNMGETAGTLTLAFVCRLGGDGVQEVWQERDGIHDGQSKSLYVEIVFGEMERLVLSADSSEYSAQLEPGEEMTMYFTGEVNENASEQWEDGDIVIDGIYIWDEAGESRLGESEDARLNAPETSTAKEPLNGEAVDGEGPTEEDLVKAPCLKKARL